MDIRKYHASIWHECKAIRRVIFLVSTELKKIVAIPTEHYAKLFTLNNRICNGYTWQQDPAAETLKTESGQVAI